MVKLTERDMRVGLFVLSILGFVAAAYSLSVEVSAQSNIIYLLLLIILLCNCGLGIAMTFPQISGSKKRLKIARGKYAVRI